MIRSGLHAEDPGLDPSQLVAGIDADLTELPVQAMARPKCVHAPLAQ